MLWILLTFVTVLQLHPTDSYMPPYYWMDEKCGQEIDMSSYGIKDATIMMAYSFFYQEEDIICNLTILPASRDTDNWDTLSVNMLEFKTIRDVCVEIYQVPRDVYPPDISRGTAIFFDDKEFCGWFSKPPVEKQFDLNPDSYLFMRYSYHQEHGILQDELEFELYFNLFKNKGGSCSGYKCDNGRCLDSGLYCSYYDPCGDGSHCKRKNYDDDDGGGIKLSTRLILGIVSACIAVLSAIFAVIKCCIYNKMGKEEKYPEVDPQPPRNVGLSSNPEYARNAPGTELQPLNSQQHEPPLYPSVTGDNAGCNGDVACTGGNADTTDVVVDVEKFPPPPSYSDVTKQH